MPSFGIFRRRKYDIRRRSSYPAANLDASTDLSARIAAVATSGTLANPAIVVLPAGSSPCDLRTLIPKGAANLVIEGHPNGSTLTCQTEIASDGMISIGRNDNDTNDAWETDGTRTLIANVIEGAMLLTRSSGSALVAGRYYALADQDTIDEWNGSSYDAIKYRGELVKVVAVDGNTATLDRPTRRAYNSTPQIVHLQPNGQGGAGDRVCRNITIRNVTLNGEFAAADYTDYGIWAAFVDGLTLSNVTLQNFRDSGIRADFCRGIATAGIVTSGEEEFASLYRGVNLYQVSDSTLTGHEASGLRHGIQLSNGCTGVTVDDYTATGSLDAAIDDHGGRNYRCTWRNCTIDTDLKFGNTSYPAGSSYCTFDTITVGGQVKIQGGSSNGTWTNVSAQRVNLTTIQGRTGDYPQNHTFTGGQMYVEAGGSLNCTFNIDQQARSGDAVRRFSGISFNDVLFRMARTDASFNTLLQSLTANSDLTLVDCVMRSNGSQENIQCEGFASGTTLTFVTTGCDFYSDRTLIGGAVQHCLHADGANTIVSWSRTNCRFFTDAENPAWILTTNSANVPVPIDVGNEIGQNPAY